MRVGAVCVSQPFWVSIFGAWEIFRQSNFLFENWSDGAFDCARRKALIFAKR